LSGGGHFGKEVTILAPSFAQWSWKTFLHQKKMFNLNALEARNKSA
jgi:hypothetical protein